jgi:hypothetical protein
MAFIFGTYNEDPGSAPQEDPLVTAQVHFSGRFCGRLELRLSEPVLRELTANMLGIDQNGPIGIDQQCDALREIANVVCGRILPLIGGRAAEFVIEPPIVLDLPPAVDGRLLSETVARARLDLDDGVCDLALAVTGGLPGRLPAEIAAIPGQSLEWDTL